MFFGLYDHRLLYYYFFYMQFSGNMWHQSIALKVHSDNVLTKYCQLDLKLEFVSWILLHIA